MSTTSAFRRHAAIVVAVFLLTRAVSFWLDRYSSTQQQVGRWAGAMYTDVNSSIPVNAILAIFCFAGGDHVYGGCFDESLASAAD